MDIKNKTARGVKRIAREKLLRRRVAQCVATRRPQETEKAMADRRIIFHHSYRWSCDGCHVKLAGGPYPSPHRFGDANRSEVTSLQKPNGNALFPRSSLPPRVKTEFSPTQSST